MTQPASTASSTPVVRAPSSEGTGGSAMARPVSVSVITATRNRTDLLARALRSIARQGLATLEAIVVDDGSRPEVLTHHESLIRELGSRFRLVTSEVAGGRGTGPSAARNRGVLHASGEFVAFLDDDDEWPSEDYLEVAVDALRARNADYLFGHLEGTRNDQLQNPGWVPDRAWLTRDPQIRAVPAVHELSDRTVLTIARRFLIHPSNSVIRRDMLMRVGGLFEGLWSHAEDQNLMLRVIDAARIVLYMPQTVATYRLPVGDSISLQEKEDLHLLQKVMAAQHARLTCERPDVRDCARAREAWTYREMSVHAQRQGRRKDARVFAGQAFVTYPSLGAAVFALRRILGGGQSDT